MRKLRRPSLVLLALALTILYGCVSLERHQVCGPPPCLHGIIPTVLTPYCCATGIDVHSLEAQIRRELAGGCHGLLVLGTLGEGETIPFEQRVPVIRTAVSVAGSCVPVIVGIHTCDVNQAIAQMRQAQQLGATAVLVKYTGNPHASGDDVLAFYAALSDSHILPILYYHFPSATGIALRPAEIAAILRLPMVIGIKESILDLREVAAHIRLTRGEGKAFFSGTALDLTQFLDLGGHGAMCPEAVLLPGPVVHAYDLYEAGRHAEARALQSQLYELVPLMRARHTSPALARTSLMTALDLKIHVEMENEPSQAKLKLALHQLGVPTPTDVHPPLPALTRQDVRRVTNVVHKLDTLDWSNPGNRAADPPEQRPAPGGLLLNTGAIQLGPGLGRNALHWLGDGEGRLE